MLKQIQFNQTYSVSSLENELAIALKNSWTPHFNKQDYEGSWESISLRSVSGSETDILSIPGISNYQDTPLLEKLPYIRSILDDWLCPKETVRLLALYPGAEIKPHRDRGCNYIGGSFRLHIPIVTNPQISFIVGGMPLILKPGTCWYVDFDEEHSICNLGDTVRVHLIIDVLRNEWTDELFAAYGYDFEEEKRIKAPDRQTILMMIEELERMNTETSLQMAAAYRNQL